MSSSGHSRKTSDISAIQNNKLLNEMNDLNAYLQALDFDDKSNLSKSNMTNTDQEEKVSTISKNITQNGESLGSSTPRFTSK